MPTKRSPNLALFLQSHLIHFSPFFTLVGKNNFIKFASAFLSKRLAPIYQVPVATKYSTKNSTTQFRLLKEIYRDYKQLKRAYPLLKSKRRRILMRMDPNYQNRRSPPPHPPQSEEITTATAGPNSSAPQPLSRRQRLLGLARATRDNYIPRLTGQVSQLANGASRALMTSNVADVYDDQGKLILPKDTSIQLFPSYTRYQEGKFFVDVKGWVSCPGLMTRKNRLILSLMRQLTRYNTTSANSTQAINQLESDNMKPDILNNDQSLSDSESIISQGSASEQLSVSSSSGSSASNADDLIKERLACFIARSIPNAELIIVVGAEHNYNQQLVTHSVFTDTNGHFEVTLEVPYRPSVVQVKSANTETIFAFQDVMMLPNEGVGIISDIDDTIKLTGVIGDKRELMTNLLLNEISSWSIPSVIKWYGEMHKHEQVSFHYVSNSPWQLFSTIQQYFRIANLPPGSVHLKQYTGNIISSLLEPSSSRKKRALYKILDDFPDKRFICVGDSGEYDLEAYVDLAQRYPGKILSINIRYVKDSLSDYDDLNILNELIRLLSTKRRKVPFNQSMETLTDKTNILPPPPPPEMEDLIDLSDSPPPFVPASTHLSRSPVPKSSSDPSIESRRKLPPMVPKKPTTLKGSPLERKPPLPNRDYLHHAQTDSVLTISSAPATRVTTPPVSSNVASDGSSINQDDDLLPPMPKRPPLPARTTEMFESNTNRLDDLDSIFDLPSFYELEEMDKKGAGWIRRLVAAMHALAPTGTKLDIFVDDDDKFFQKNCFELNEIMTK
ncbi:uncharacterized protein J8A68_004915 [[Candida] subhashii]|uniref:Phosphatidate phosphatase APP1 catalytic domain-containing protein n=1 Tax=[Candida] subhashii TaxID=561895 RepID=A0A8J5UK10_9ASCO|nr:uncharacterized protein J8A68_004915 [[Candida] subhashii]KAG7661546.1 hypothetical protein J8A68_004915 [[Candida] subhashii]